MSGITPRIPHYLKVKSDLLELIKELSADQKVPSEMELAAKYNISRGTAKQAIMELVNEGVLYRIQGKGTFVSPSKIRRNPSRLPSFTDELKSIGGEPLSKKLFFDEIEPPAHIAKKLGIGEGTVYRYERLVEEIDSPVAVVTSYLHPQIFPGLLEKEIGTSLYSSLAEFYQIGPTRANDTYVPQNASKRIATLLGIKTGKAIFYSERLSFLSNGSPFEFVESYIRSDRFTLEIHFSKEVETDVPYYGFRFGNNSAEVPHHG